MQDGHSLGIMIAAVPEQGLPTDSLVLKANLFVATSGAASIGLLPFVDRPFAATLFLASVFVPAFMLAHWMMSMRATPEPPVD